MKPHERVNRNEKGPDLHAAVRSRHVNGAFFIKTGFRPTRLFALKGSFVGLHLFGFIFCENTGGNGRDHCGAGASVPDYIQHLAVRLAVMEFGISKIPGAWIEYLSGIAVAMSAHAVTSKAGAFPFKDRLSFRNDGGIADESILLGLRRSQLIGRDTRLTRFILLSHLRICDIRT
jgi:hypothetical protein